MFSPQFFKIFFCSFLILSLPKLVFSQQNFKISLSPFLIEERVESGEKFEREVILNNGSSQKLKISIELGDIQLDERGNVKILPGGSQKFSLKDWVEVKEKEIELLPQETKKIKVFFNIPKEAAGSRQGILRFLAKPESLPFLDEGVFASFSHQLGTLIFVVSKTNIKEEAKILQFFADKKIYFTPFKVKFHLEVENLGNVFIEPQAKLEIKNFLFQKKEQIELNPQRLKILPQSKRIFEGYFEKKFGWGKYEADLFLIFGTPKNEGGEGIKTLRASTFFWVIPLREILFLIFVLILIFFAVKILKRRPK